MLLRPVHQIIVSSIRKITHRRWFQTPHSEIFFCGHVHETIDDIFSRLKLSRYLINDVFEFNENGQVGSAKKFLKGDKQIHIKLFKGKIPGTLDVHAHKEYTYWKRPIQHINKIELENCCDKISHLFAFCNDCVRL